MLVLPAINTQGAHLIALVCSISFAGTCSPADTDGNTWVGGGQNFTGPGQQGVRLFWVLAPPITSGSDIVTITGTGANITAEVAVFNIGSALDVQAQGTATIGTTQAGSITPTVNGDIIIAGVTANSTVSSLSIDSGFIVTDASPAPVAWPSGMAYLIQSTAAAINPTWTGPTQPLSATITAFKP